MPNALKIATLIGMIAVLCASAAPASAWWEATGKQLKGQVKVIEKEIGFEKSGLRVGCLTDTFQATWGIQTGGQIKQHEKEGKQTQTKSGPHLYIQIKSWGNGCVQFISVFPFLLPAKIEPCELQLAQAKGSLTATLGVVTTCVIHIPECTIQIPAGMETQPESNEGINVGLNQLKLENKGNNQIAQGQVNELTGFKVPSEGCSGIVEGLKLTDPSSSAIELELMGVKVT